MVKVGDIVTIVVTEQDEYNHSIKHTMRDGIVSAIGSERILYTRNGIEYDASKSDVYLSAFPDTKET